MTLSAILLDLYRRLGYGTSPAADVTTRLTAFVAETLQDIISEPGIGSYLTLNQPPVTITSAASQAVYAVPNGVQRIDAITDRTNQITLEMRDLHWYRANAPNPNTYLGTPTVWIPFGFMAVAAQPSAATGLWAVSTSVSDTTQSVKIETVRTGGVTYSSALTLNGTTRVALGALTDHVQVTKFYVSAVGVGDINLYNAASSGTLLATIPIGQTFSRYAALALWPTPAGVITYYLDGERPLADMSNATDEPPFPARFHRILIDGALMREWDKKDDTRGREAGQRYRRTLSQMRYFITCPPDYLPRRQALVPRKDTQITGAGLGSTSFYSSFVTVDPTSPNESDVWILQVSTSPLVFRIRTRVGGVNVTLYEVTI